MISTCFLRNNGQNGVFNSIQVQVFNIEHTERRGAVGWYPWAPFFRLAMLTLQRREEVAGMRWSEIADDFAIWCIPANRMKNGKPHDVHLSEAARAVLRAVPKAMACDFVFTTTGTTPVSGFSGAKEALDAAITKARAARAAKLGANAAPLIPWRLHDLRRTGVSTLARLGFDSIVVDMLLAHQPAKLRGRRSCLSAAQFRARARPRIGCLGKSRRWGQER
jgi:integrase